jgi:hypothetical protein
VNDFLRYYGIVLITSAVGLILVVIGLIFKQQEVTTSGLVTLGGALGIHIGGNTSAVPVRMDDAVATVSGNGGTIIHLPLVDETGKP